MQQGGQRTHAILFFVFWLFIIFVSVFDGYLAVRHRADLHRGELNPIGRALIAANGGQVWLLVAAKFAGTVVACSLLLLIFSRNRRFGITIAGVLAALQLWLLLFLLFG